MTQFLIDLCKLGEGRIKFVKNNGKMEIKFMEKRSHSFFPSKLNLSGF